MEDEDLLENLPIDPPKNQTDSIFEIMDKLGVKKTNRTDLNANQTIYGAGTTMGTSQYDKTLQPETQLNLADLQKNLEAFRSRKQPNIDKFGNTLGRLTNIIPEAIGGVAAALDFEDYNNSNQEVGNWLSKYMNEWKESTNQALPIYRQNRDKPLDFGDSSWWFENGSNLVNSIGGFAISGGVLGKSIQGLSKIAKVKNIASAIAGVSTGAKITAGLETGLTALTLNQAEGILEATEVFDQTLEFQKQKFIQQGYKEEEATNLAKEKAAEAAEIAINTNRINILLNLTSANLFLKSPRNIISKPITFNNIKRGALEGTQESAEEVINYIASQRGKTIGQDKEYGIKELVNDISSPQAAEAALLGFIGGMGQTIVTTEGINRLSKTTNPETGKKMSVKEYNNYIYSKQKEILDQYELATNSSNVKDFTTVFSSFQDQQKLRKEYDKAIKNKDEAKANDISYRFLDNQAFIAFKNGTTENLIKTYEELQNGPQKEGMDSDYKQKADKAISRIKKLEKAYINSENQVNSRQLYMNRALTIDLEDKFDYINSKQQEVGAELITKANRFNRQEPITNLTEVPVSIKEDPLYKEYKDLNSTLDKIEEDIKSLNKEYKTISSNKYQKDYKDIITEKAVNAQEELDKTSKKVEKQAEEEAKEEAKQQTLKKQEEKLEEVKESKKNEEDNINEGVKRKAYNKLVGEKINLPDSDGNQIEAEIYEVKDDYISAIDDGGNEYKIPLPGTKTKTKPDIKSKDEVDEVVEEVKEETVEETYDGSRGSKVISVDDNGNKFGFIDQSFIDYQLTPRDKRGEEVSFEINYKAKGKNKLWDNALKGYDSLVQGEKLSKEQIDFLIDNLPINVKVADNVSAPLATLPSTDKSKQIFNSTDKILRINIINALVNGNDISNIKSKINYQNGGQIQLENEVVENSILELDQIDNKYENLKFYYVNDNGDLENYSKEIIPMALAGKGEIYIDYKKANGLFYPLKLNIKKVSSIEADILYDLYEILVNESLNYNTRLEEFDKNLIVKIKTNLADEIKIIGKPFKEVTAKDIIDILVWDGSKTDKSRLTVNKNALFYGDQKIYKNNFTQENKEKFIDWVTNNKRRNINFKNNSNKTTSYDMSDVNYIKYLVNNKILNTNAKVNQPTFAGKTNIFINNDISVDKIEEIEAQGVSLYDSLENSSEDVENKINNSILELEKERDLLLKKEGKLVYETGQDSSGKKWNSWIDHRDYINDLYKEKIENIEKKISNSENNFVPLHKIENTMENEKIQEVIKDKSKSKKLSPTERKKAAAEFRKRKKDC